jgi:8-oxo-dGTP diphosphatase
MKIGKDYIGVGVGAVIMNEDGKFLLMKRGPKSKSEVGTWEKPGGSVEFGETLENALKREVKEELGVAIKIIKLLHVADHIIDDEQQHWVSPAYICKIVSGVPKIKEPDKCDEIGWFSIEEAIKLPLAIVTRQDIEVLKKVS